MMRIAGQLFSKKGALVASAAAVAIGFAAPAAAGDRYGHGYHGHYYHGGHGYYYDRGYYHRRRHHRGGGGKAAAIALGVIGGAIILNELAEDKAERRYSNSRYYDARYNERYRPSYNDRYRYYDTQDRRSSYDRYNDRYEYERDDEGGAYKRGFEQGYAQGRGQSLEQGAPADLLPPRDERVEDLRDGDILDDDLDSRLDGGPKPIRYSADKAFKSCIVHARAALSERGYMLAAPGAPDTAEDMGRGWRLTATISAQSRNGESWSRAMYCEADASRVHLLELI